MYKKCIVYPQTYTINHQGSALHLSRQGLRAHQPTDALPGRIGFHGHLSDGKNMALPSGND